MCVGCGMDASEEAHGNRVEDRVEWDFGEYRLSAMSEMLHQ